MKGGLIFFESFIVYIFYLVLGLYPQDMCAQKQRNYIYVFDCTASMLGINDVFNPANPVHNQKMKDPNTLYSVTKKWLKDDIERNTDNQTTFVIVPYHQQPHQAMQFTRKGYNWGKIEQTLDGWMQKSGRTGICKAWDLAIKYVDNNKDNYFYLLTDGVENVDEEGSASVVKRVRDWCAATSQNSYAFYVALNKVAIANCPGLEKAVAMCNRVKLINSHQGPFGSFSFDTIYISNRDKKTKSLGFSAVGKFPVKIDCNDPYFSVKSSATIENGGIDFVFVNKANLNVPSYEFSFNVVSDSNVLQIENPKITVIVDNRNVRSLEVAEMEIDGGDLSYYDKFLFWNAKTPDTAEIHLNPDWNPEAKKDNSYMDLSIDCSDKTMRNNYTLLYKDDVVNPNRFSISSSDTDRVLKIVISPSAKEGNYYFSIKGVGHDMELINGEPTNIYDNSFRIDYDVVINPLLLTLIFLAIIIVAMLLLWFLFLRRAFFPRFKGVSGFQITQPYFKMQKLRGYRKVVFGNGVKKQGWLNELFAGKILYENNAAWTNSWELEPAITGKGVRIKYSPGTYYFSSTMLKRGDSIDIKDNQRNTYVIKIN